MGLNPTNQVQPGLPLILGNISFGDPHPTAAAGQMLLYTKVVDNGTGRAEAFIVSHDGLASQPPVQLSDAGTLPGGGGSGGSTWYTSAGAPSAALGVNGDFYLDSSNGDYYTKSAGTWVIQGNLTGPQGPQGNPGADGSDGSPGTPGADGADGEGVPVGGTAGQVLKKVSGTDYDTEWANESGGGGGGDLLAANNLSDVANAATSLANLGGLSTSHTSSHAPSDAQKNSDITKAEIEAKLTGEITTHTHPGGGGSGVTQATVTFPAGASVAARAAAATGFPAGWSAVDGSNGSVTITGATSDDLVIITDLTYPADLVAVFDFFGLGAQQRVIPAAGDILYSDDFTQILVKGFETATQSQIAKLSFLF